MSPPTIPNNPSRKPTGKAVRSINSMKKKSLEELNPQLETYNSNEPSEPIIDPWDFREFMNFLFLPFLIAMLVLFVFAFNASMNAYIYSKLKDK